MRRLPAKDERFLVKKKTQSSRLPVYDMYRGIRADSHDLLHRLNRLRKNLRLDSNRYSGRANDPDTRVHLIQILIAFESPYLLDYICLSSEKYRRND